MARSRDPQVPPLPGIDAKRSAVSLAVQLYAYYKVALNPSVFVCVCVRVCPLT